MAKGNKKGSDKSSKDRSVFAREWNRLTMYVKEHPVSMIIQSVLILLIAAFIVGTFAVVSLRFKGKTAKFNTLVYGLFNIWTYIIFILATVVAFVIRFKKRDSEDDATRNFSVSGSDALGSARFINEDELVGRFLVDTVENTTEPFFGYKLDENDEKTNEVISAIPDAPPYLNGHKIIVGGSGTQKTTTQLLNDALQAVRRGESIICTDPKGELYAFLKILLEKNGYNVKQFNLVSPTNSDAIDFLGELRSERGDESEMLTNVEILAEAIIMNTGTSDETAYWRDQAKAALKGALIYELERGSQASFRDVYELILKPAKEFCDDINALPNDRNQMHPARAAIKSYTGLIESGKLELAEQGLAGLRTRLQVFINPTLLDIVSHKEMDLVAPTEGKCAYFVISSDMHSTMNFLKNMFFSLSFIKLTAHVDRMFDRKPMRVNMLLDEFPSLGHLEDFQEKLNVLRSRRISITMVVQDFAQLIRNYPDLEYESIIEACDVNVYLGGNDILSTTDYYAKRLGTSTVDTISTRHQRFVPNPNYMVNEGVNARDLMAPYELLLKNLDLNFVFIKATRPMKVGKFHYKDHPLAKQIENTNYSLHIPDWRREEAGYPSAKELSDHDLFPIDDYIRRFNSHTEGVPIDYIKYLEMKEAGPLPEIDESMETKMFRRFTDAKANEKAERAQREAERLSRKKSFNFGGGRVEHTTPERQGSIDDIGTIKDEAVFIEEGAGRKAAPVQKQEYVKPQQQNLTTFYEDDDDETIRYSRKSKPKHEPKPDPKMEKLKEKYSGVNGSTTITFADGTVPEHSDPEITEPVKEYKKGEEPVIESLATSESEIVSMEKGEVERKTSMPEPSVQQAVPNDRVVRGTGQPARKKTVKPMTRISQPTGQKTYAELKEEAARNATLPVPPVHKKASPVFKTETTIANEVVRPKEPEVNPESEEERIRNF